MRELFYELIQEASTGKVGICDDDWPVAFNTIINRDGEEISYYDENNLATLTIKEEDKFIDALEEYVEYEMYRNRKTPNFYKDNERNKKKWIMMYLFSYATTEDFQNPLAYIKKRIEFLTDNTFDYLKEKKRVPLTDKVQNLSIELGQEECPVSMETPNRINISIVEEQTKCPLPSIYYAIREENHEKVCTIYSLIKPKNTLYTKDSEELYKRVNRLLFKINDDITSREDYVREDEANIKDVSMSFILSLNIFLSLLQSQGINKVKVVSYLPVTYSARELVASETGKRSLHERNQSIQENVTNKFIRSFRRVAAQNDSVQIESYPYEVDEFLTLSLKPREKELDNMLLEETSRPIIEGKLK